MNEIVLRLYVETPDDAGAEKVADSVVKRVGRGLKLSRREVKPYPKIPAYRELFLVFTAPVDTMEVTSLSKMLGFGWTEAAGADEPAFVWTAGGTATFFSPLVRWANLELVRS